MLIRLIAPLWGLAGIFFLLGFAVYRLTPKAIEAIGIGLSSWEWLALPQCFALPLIDSLRGLLVRQYPRVPGLAGRDIYCDVG